MDGALGKKNRALYYLLYPVVGKFGWEDHAALKAVIEKTPKTVSARKGGGQWQKEWRDIKKFEKRRESSKNLHTILNTEYTQIETGTNRKKHNLAKVLTGQLRGGWMRGEK